MGSQPTIAHYAIVSKLGEGGMGVVYRATDTKLRRDVAIKMLPPAFAADEDRVRRLIAEARVLATLNHPNIAAIYGVEEHALVMEFVEGKTLAGPLPLETALDYARQIAAALEYAHEKGIVHRDLKPANIKITPQGVVKVLDFGLAKAVEEPESPGDDTATLTAWETAAGVVVGTVGYMSPEQARGGGVDKRTDIWAFGVVLYEILTGRRPFQAETRPDTLAAVLSREPDWNAVPARAQPLLRKCLEKDARKRLRDIGDAALLLDATPETAAAAAVRRPQRLAIAMLVLLSMGLAAALWRSEERGTRPEPAGLMRFNAELGPNWVPDSGDGPGLALSPDGSRLAYVARGQGGAELIAIRPIGQASSTLLQGAENGRIPFFSPDGKWLGFFADGKMKKIPVQGGPVTTLCDAPGPRGAWWGQDGFIVASLSFTKGLFRVPQGGGVPEAITDPAANGEVTHRWPQVLPGGQAVLFTGHAVSANYDEANIEVVSLKSGKVKTVLQGGYYGRYVPTGHLLYVKESTLYAVPFDLTRLEVRGASVALLDDVAGNRGNGAGAFDALNGMLLYLSTGAPPNSRIVWIDRDTQLEPIAVPAGRYSAPRVSADGRRVAFLSKQGGGGDDIEVYDLESQAITRLTFTHNVRNPVWTPDGKHIVFTAESARSLAIRWIRADGAAEPRTLIEDKNELLPYSFSPDGTLAFTWITLNGGYDIWTLPLDMSAPDNPKAGAPQPFLQTRFNEMTPAFSPDGRWIAYRSEEPDASGVYVRPFRPRAEADSAKWQISTGGAFPAWSRTGSELFFLNDGQVMAADINAAGDSFTVSRPRPWSSRKLPERRGACCVQSYMDLAPGGDRFVTTVLEPGNSPSWPSEAVVLLNFFDELRHVR